MEEKSNNTVYDAALKILMEINATRKNTDTRNLLIELRKSIDRDNEKNMNLIAYTTKYLDKEDAAYGNKINDKELAIFTALQMYALQQVGNGKNVLKYEYEDGKPKQNIAVALKTLRGKNSQILDRRFNAMIATKNFNELKNHLIYLIKHLKTSSYLSVDYAKLAEDLFFILIQKGEYVRANWSRTYYRPMFKKETEEKTEEKIENKDN